MWELYTYLVYFAISGSLFSAISWPLALEKSFLPERQQLSISWIVTVGTHLAGKGLLGLYGLCGSSFHLLLQEIGSAAK